MKGRKMSKIKQFLLKKINFSATFKKFLKKLKKNPELQLVTVLTLGVLAGGLIIFGFSRDSQKTNNTNTTPTLAQNITSNQAQVNQ